MAYRIEFDEVEYVDMLKPVFANVMKEEADILIVTADGDTIETHKILLSLFSRTLASIISVLPLGERVQGISVPVKTETVRSLVKLLEEGIVFVEDKDDLSDVALCGQVLGIDLTNLAIVDQKHFDDIKREELQDSEIKFEQWEFKNEDEIKVESEDSEIKLEEWEFKNEKEIVEEIKVESEDSEIKLEEWEFKNEKEIVEEIKVEPLSVKEEFAPETVDQKSYPCTKCERKLPSLVRLQTHLLTIHLHAIEIQQKCPACGKVYKNRKGLQAHLKEHTGKKSFKCEFCEKSFFRSTHLKSHNLTHGKDSLELAKLLEQRKVDCPECGKTLRNQQTLNSHMKYTHSNLEPFKCDECGSQYKKLSTLNDHKLLHSQPMKFKCEECESKFRRKSHLRNHKQSCKVQAKV